MVEIRHNTVLKIFCLLYQVVCYISTVEPRYNKFLGTMEINLLYQVSQYYIRVKNKEI